MERPTESGTAADEMRTASATAPAEADGRFTCPIMHELMVEPVYAMDGLLYDWKNIDAWMAEHNTSPLTRETLPRKYIRTHELVDAYAAYRASIGLPPVKLPTGAFSVYPSQTQFLKSVGAGDTSAVERHLATGHVPQALLDYGLIAACNNGRTSIVPILLQHGADPTVACGTSIYLALIKRDVSILQTLLERCVRLGDTCRNPFPGVLAHVTAHVVEENFACSQLLDAFGRVRDSVPYIPLRWAVAANDTSRINGLLPKPPPPSLLSMLLDHALTAGKTTGVRHLLEAGAAYDTTACPEPAQIAARVAANDCTAEQRDMWLAVLCSRCTDDAVINQRKPAIRALLDAGTPIPASLLAMCISGGSLWLLKIFQEQNVPYTEACWIAAIRYNSPRTFDYVVQAYNPSRQALNEALTLSLVLYNQETNRLAAPLKVRGAVPLFPMDS